MKKKYLRLHSLKSVFNEINDLGLNTYYSSFYNVFSSILLPVLFVCNISIKNGKEVGFYRCFVHISTCCIIQNSKLFIYCTQAKIKSVVYSYNISYKVNLNIENECYHFEHFTRIRYKYYVI